MSFTAHPRSSGRQRAASPPIRRPRRPRRRTQLVIEILEGRFLPSGFRTIDGSSNNLGDVDEGKAGIHLFRIAPAAYADGVSAPVVGNPLRPNARLISNVLSDQTDPADPTQDLNLQNNKALSDFIYVFGQFLDHDLDLTTDNSGQAFNIPPGSPTDPMGMELFTRSEFDPTTGSGTGNPRQQLNSVTSWIDGSQIYGSDATKASALRTHVGGRLKVQIEDGASFLPFNAAPFFTTPIDMANDADIVPDAQLFAAGDWRANENIELTAMQTLFVREHNRIADQIHASNPSLSDEMIYQLARRRVGAELQIIVYNEWLPALLGANALPAYTGYNPHVSADIANEFSTAMFRFAHSQLDNDVERRNNDGTAITDGSVDLAHAFFNPTLIHLPSVLDPFSGNLSTGINVILKAAASADAQEVDLQAVRDVRNFLFGPPGAGGTDLIARDIQRGRDHGLTDYNSMRAAYGLPRVSRFAQITSNVTVQQELQQLYGTVDNIDAFVGTLAEDHVPGADVGPLTRAVLIDQFRRLRDGDRFFFLNSNEFSPAEQADLLATTSLAKIIEWNTDITDLQADVFHFRASIRGTVYADPDGNGIRESTEPGLHGFTVDLHDATGAVIATTVTDTNGSYRFDEQELDGTGNYTVSVELPSGWTQNATEVVHNPGNLAISRGDINVTFANFGVQSTNNALGGAAGSVAPLTNVALGPQARASELSQAAASDQGVPGATMAPLPERAIPDQQPGLDPTLARKGSEESNGAVPGTTDAQAIDSGLVELASAI